MASWGVRCSWLGVVVLAIGVTGATAQPAPAPPEPRSPAAPTGAAADLHDAGFAHAKAWRTSKDRRDLEQAERLFKQALALGDSALIECDLAISLLHLDAPARALALFARCVPRLAAIDPKIVNRYRDREGELLGKIGATHVAVDVTTSPPGAVVSISSFPADETVVTPSLVWLPVGEHTLVAHVDGHDDAREVITIATDDLGKARRQWRVTLARSAVPLRLDPVAGPTRPSRTPAYVALGVGGAFLLGGAVVHVLGRSVRDDLAGLSGDAYDDKLPSWQRYQRATIGLYAGAAVAVGVGAWLWRRSATAPSVSVSSTPGGPGAMIWFIAPRP